MKENIFFQKINPVKFASQLFNRVNQNLSKRRKLLFLLADLILITLAVFLAYFLRFEGKIPSEYIGNLKAVIILTLLFCLPIFYSLKLYSFSWSYVSTSEVITLFKATTLSFLLLGVALFFLKEEIIFRGFPRSILFISYFVVLIFSGGFRISKRIYLQLFPKRTTEGKAKTLIVGAGDAGEQILRSIIAGKVQSPYLPVGFIDDSPSKQGLIIHGLKVLGKIDDIPKIIKEKNIKSLIIAMPSAGSDIIKKAVERGREGELKDIKVVPSIAEIINGQLSIRDLKELQIEDLLARDQVFLDLETIRNFISKKRVLITGAAGSIGSELSRQVAKFNPSLLLILDQDETGIFQISEEIKERFPRLNSSAIIGDICDKEKIERVFAKFSPQIVFHAAAYKHVPVMEKHPDEAVKNNIFGTKIVAETALKQGTEKFVFISTDKVINPSSVMGATKRVGEMVCQVLNKEALPTPFAQKQKEGGGFEKTKTKFVSVRFGNVLDSRGNVISVFKEQIRKGGPVKITHPEMKRYFMTTPEACLLVMQAGAIGQGGEVFILDMGEPIKITDLAKELIRLSGFEPDKDIPIVFTWPRPGEKLFEEILTTEEGTVATKSEKIFMARLSDVDGEKLNQGLEKLKAVLQDGNKDGIIKILKEMVPSYKPAD